MSSPRHRLVPQYFGSLVFDRETGRYSAYDRETTDLFLAALHEDADAVIGRIGPPERRAAAAALLADERRRGTVGRRFLGAPLDLDPPAGHLAGPLAVHLEVTRRCQLSCAHCFAAPAEGDAPLALGELEALFGDLAALGSFRLGLTGGEPLLRPDLLEVIDLAIAAGLVPCLTTNGLAMTPALARALGARPLGWLNLSLDGATAATHDALRGPGAFEAAMRAARLLSRHAPFAVAFTVTRHTAREARALALLARELGARAVVLRPLYPAGRAAARPDLLPSFAEYVGALEAIAAMSEVGGTEAGPVLCNAEPFGPGARLESRSVVAEGFGCGAGQTVCSVSASGAVSPCSFLGPAFVAGTLRRLRFREIWDDSPVFVRFRELEGNPRCDGCGRYDACGGGCRLRALHASGSLDAPDPYCLMELGGERRAGREWTSP